MIVEDIVTAAETGTVAFFEAFCGERCREKERLLAFDVDMSGAYDIGLMTLRRYSKGVGDVMILPLSMFQELDGHARNLILGYYKIAENGTAALFVR